MARTPESTLARPDYGHGPNHNEWADWGGDPAPGDAWADTGTPSTGGEWDAVDWGSMQTPASSSEVVDDGWNDWGDPSAPTAEAYSPASAPEQEQSRESRLARIKAAIGRGATRLVELVRGRSLGGIFGSEGTVARGIDRTISVTNRADKIANGRTARAASHIPIAGKYVGAARDLVHTAQGAAEVAGHYRNIVGGAEQAYGDRDQLIGNARAAAYDAGKDIVKGGLDGALDVVADRTGISIDTESRRVAVRSRKLGGFAWRLVKSGGVGELVSVGAEAARSGADGMHNAAAAKSAQTQEYAKSIAHQAYDTGEIAW